MRLRTALPAALAALALGVTSLAGPSTAAPAPDFGTPDHLVHDLGNIAAAYGRITGPGGQLRNPAYLPALVQQASAVTVAQLLAQVATPHRLALTAGMVVPGWNVGNPLRAGWERTRGRMRDVAFTNRFGALLRGTVYAPRAGARDPYTGVRLKGPFPGVVITTGSVQGSENMYRWLAQDLAERGYVVLTYDVQGQGRSETLPHTSGAALPFCELFGTPAGQTADGTAEETGCPGVPFQQLSNFTTGTSDAIDFFVSRPGKPYRGKASGDVRTHRFNPYWRLWDRSPDPRPATPGRRTRLAIVGHSMGARAVSYVQGHDKRVAAVVALDKLSGPSATGPLAGDGVRPAVPALALQAEYGFTVAPSVLGGDSLAPSLSTSGPDPMRERRTGYDAWRRAGVDAMLVVGRATTHLDYTDIPLVLPASRWGQALSSVLTQAWLDRYLKHDRRDRRLLRPRFRYLEPVGNGRWEPVVLRRPKLLSSYYCSAYGFRSGKRVRTDPDWSDVGCR
ncbi:alpha/beta hydrolase [Nocardioides massiliensis]|uniref:Alpha-beta hydrolase superfamily lysophospholipase n=1 Tax=Nocardioides massiliensis TaxID=1325935 RepID=A0ABT9NNK5_9ACTN|nr:alpha/beta hydrolase [Nocardioides massiliensis]MDP9821998.1 alpha-beta hydrolase superfamily lysophospholipase [Nocardioides massiliensis]